MSIHSGCDLLCRLGDSGDPWDVHAPPTLQSNTRFSDLVLYKRHAVSFCALCDGVTMFGLLTLQLEQEQPEQEPAQLHWEQSQGDILGIKVVVEKLKVL